MLILGLLFSIFAFNNVSQIHADDTSTRIDITTDIRDKLLYSDEYETYLDKYGESPNHNSTFDNRFLFTSDEKTNVNYRIFYFIFILNNDTSSIEIGNDLDNFYYIYSDEIKHDSLDYSLKYELYFADKEINLVGSPATGNILDTSEEKILDVKIPSEAAYFVIQLTFTNDSFSDDKYQDLIPLIYVIEHKNNEKEKPQLKIVYFVSPDDERFYNNVNNKGDLNNIIDKKMMVSIFILNLMKKIQDYSKSNFSLN